MTSKNNRKNTKLQDKIGVVRAELRAQHVEGRKTWAQISAWYKYVDKNYKGNDKGLRQISIEYQRKQKPKRNINYIMNINNSVNANIFYIFAKFLCNN